jgi:hypothetical protein
LPVRRRPPGGQGVDIFPAWGKRGLWGQMAYSEIVRSTKVVLVRCIREKGVRSVRSCRVSGPMADIAKSTRMTQSGRQVRRVERFFNGIKQCRRVATRCDKLAANCLAFIQLASIRLWVRVNESTPPMSRLNFSKESRFEHPRNDFRKSMKCGLSSPGTMPQLCGPAPPGEAMSAFTPSITPTGKSAGTWLKRGSNGQTSDYQSALGGVASVLLEHRRPCCPGAAAPSCKPYRSAAGGHAGVLRANDATNPVHESAS